MRPYLKSFSPNKYSHYSSIEKRVDQQNVIWPSSPSSSEKSKSSLRFVRDLCIIISGLFKLIIIKTWNAHISTLLGVPGAKLIAAIVITTFVRYFFPWLEHYFRCMYFSRGLVQSSFTLKHIGPCHFCKLCPSSQITDFSCSLPSPLMNCFLRFSVLYRILQINWKPNLFHTLFE